MSPQGTEGLTLPVLLAVEPSNSGSFYRPIVEHFGAQLHILFLILRPFLECVAHKLVLKLTKALRPISLLTRVYRLGIVMPANNQVVETEL